jgi:hypothetical protein
MLRCEVFANAVGVFIFPLQERLVIFKYLCHVFFFEKFSLPTLYPFRLPGVVIVGTKVNIVLVFPNLFRKFLFIFFRK